MPASPVAYAIDFGTTNSLIAAASADQTWQPITVDPLALDPTLLRSVLYFSPETEEFRCGLGALRACAAAELRGRLIRSIKRFLPAPSFTTTRIGNRRFTIEELVAVILSHLRERANAEFGGDVRVAVVGCPARFSDRAEEDSLARQRLERAAGLAGFEQVALCEEPVAAALDCGQSGNRSQLIAVADLGGGTSDFTVSRVHDGQMQVLAVSGIGIAGDALDGSLMRDHISPYFGSRSTYQWPTGGNVLSFPKPLLAKLCSPAELSLLERREALEFLRTIRRCTLSAEDRERLDALLCVVEDHLGFQLFEAIEATKQVLSSSSTADFSFTYPGIELSTVVSRSGFEQSAFSQIQRILERFAETLTTAGVACADLDRVYLTGGTSKVPAVAAAIAEQVGAHKISQVRTFHAVIQGLADRARTMVRKGQLG